MDVFYALAEPKRRMIVELLASDGQLAAGQICSKFDITAQAISQHLKILLDARLVLMERHAQKRIYRLNTETVSDVGQWASHTEKLWNGRLDRLDAVLKSEKKKHAKK